MQHMRDQTSFDRERCFSSELGHVKAQIGEVEKAQNIVELLLLMAADLQKELFHIRKYVLPVVDLSLLSKPNALLKDDVCMAYSIDQLAFLQYFSILERLYCDH